MVIIVCLKDDISPLSPPPEKGLLCLSHPSIKCVQTYVSVFWPVGMGWGLGRREMTAWGKGWSWGATPRPECLRRLTIVRVHLARLRPWAPGEYQGPPHPKSPISLCFLSLTVSLWVSPWPWSEGHLIYQLDGVVPPDLRCLVKCIPSPSPPLLCPVACAAPCVVCLASPATHPALPDPVWGDLACVLRAASLLGL